MNTPLQQAIQLQQQGNVQAAFQLYQQILKEQPDDEGALVNSGIILFQAKKVKEGLALLQKAVQRHPQSINALFNLGYALMQANVPQQAMECFQQVVQLQPQYFSAWLHLGNLNQAHGKRQVAYQCFEQAYRLNPKSLEVFVNWANNCIALKNFDQALRILHKALSLYPDRWEIHGNLATVYKEQWRLQLAETSFLKALELNPHDPQLHQGLGAVYHHWNKKEKALSFLKKARQLAPENAKLFSDYIYHLNYYPNISPEEIYRLHVEWGRKFSLPSGEKPFSRYSNNNSGKIRIGLLSGDFCYHPVAVFLLGWLGKMDTEKFELFAYAEVRNRDGNTEKFQNLCQWYETNGKLDREVATQIHADGIDVLIDLAGHTKGNRLSVMGYRAAPVQASYLGYINTTGLTSIDYRIADQWVNPESTQTLYSEKLVHLPNSYTCWQAPELEQKVNVKETPCLKNGFITFGCFNNPAKLNEEVAKVWGEILTSVPHSKLMLKARHFSDREGIEPIAALFTEQGIAPNRLIFEGPSVFMEYFEAYNRMDIALDPFPHHGGTTTHDALYMGVPVITLEGTTYVHRMGVSIMHNLGKPEWIASTKTAYIEKAVQLASAPEKLNAIRKGLRSQFLNAPLCDGKAFAQNMSELFTSLAKV